MREVPSAPCPFRVQKEYLRDIREVGACRLAFPPRCWTTMSESGMKKGGPFCTLLRAGREIFFEVQKFVSAHETILQYFYAGAMSCLREIDIFEVRGALSVRRRDLTGRGLPDEHEVDHERKEPACQQGLVGAQVRVLGVGEILGVIESLNSHVGSLEDHRKLKSTPDVHTHGRIGIRLGGGKAALRFAHRANSPHDEWICKRDRGGGVFDIEIIFQMESVADQSCLVIYAPG